MCTKNVYSKRTHIIVILYGRATPSAFTIDEVRHDLFFVIVNRRNEFFFIFKMKYRLLVASNGTSCKTPANYRKTPADRLTTFSLSLSRADVASSNRRMGGFLMMARAMAIR